MSFSNPGKTLTLLPSGSFNHDPTMDCLISADCGCNWSTLSSAWNNSCENVLAELSPGADDTESTFTTTSGRSPLITWTPRAPAPNLSLNSSLLRNVVVASPRAPSRREAPSISVVTELRPSRFQTFSSLSWVSGSTVFRYSLKSFCLALRMLDPVTLPMTCPAVIPAAPITPPAPSP